MMAEYESVLNGVGNTDYEKYMRTDDLLSLQQADSELLHQDERLFQTVHQVTELWLKQAVFEVESSVTAISDREDLDAALSHVQRATMVVSYLKDQLGILATIRPTDFQLFRPALGNGSGLESPGWKGIQKASQRMAAAMKRSLSGSNLSYADVFASEEPTKYTVMLEVMIDWDDAVSEWRTRHYKVATRVIGNDAVGTKGMPVFKLAELLDRRFFDDLWEARFGRSQNLSSNGDTSEDVWLELFQQYLPERYSAEKAHVVDSEGVFSDQIDVVVFDRQYSPFIHKFKGSTVIPAESVYAIFEAKQIMDASLVAYAQNKIASVRKLTRTSLPIPHAGSEYPPKTPFHILGGMLTFESEWKPPFGNPFNKALEGDFESGRLDLGCERHMVSLVEIERQANSW